MQSITVLLTQKIADAFLACGYEEEYGTVVFSKTSFSQFQCNGAMAAAKRHKRNPLDIAHQVKATVGEQEFFTVDVLSPGFINIDLADEFLADYCAQMLQLDQLGFEPSANPLTIIIDYGGPNIAKPLHVGHLRSAIIGQAIKNTARFMGHTVVGDVHLGDWGLQMGMVMTMFIQSDEHLASLVNQKRIEDLATYPIAIQDLETIYPRASALAKQDHLFLGECRWITAELQKGHEAYTALWGNIVRTSVVDLKKNYANLNVDFEEWKGESDSQPVIPSMVNDLKQRGYAYESEGALVVDVALPTDTSAIPPLILSKSDGASLYSTTDLATIIQRKSQYNPDYILYVVDKRQATHFQQVFRCADKVGLTQSDLKLEFIAFGTMNGQDG
ncbi:MAG: arginine--tRNA ligase, partial [Cytophagaceae bacterium]